MRSFEWEVGDACLACWSGDGELYECRLTSVEEGSRRCTVSFVGYEDVQTVEMADLHKYYEHRSLVEAKRRGVRLRSACKLVRRGGRKRRRPHHQHSSPGDGATAEPRRRRRRFSIEVATSSCSSSPAAAPGAATPCTLRRPSRLDAGGNATSTAGDGGAAEAVAAKGTLAQEEKVAPSSSIR